ncbi:MAG TPA: hypothetical protein VJ036_00450, partial [bacterium]|nr:hypothetical protein [bacterium]
ELWMGNDGGLLIMPGSIPLDVPVVRDELTRHLSEGWNAVVDREVDGKKSIPYQTDQSNPRYGNKLAARRVARTVMLGSAPTVRAQHVRGIESMRIRLGVVQPGENIADFNDALNTLQSSLAYLYSNPSGNRFWYDTRPTLRKTVADRATQIPASEVEYELESRLQALRKEKPFAGLHTCPGSSLDVPDEQAVRLVILRPTDEYKASNPLNRALTAARDILDNRGQTPRIYRNMLAFIAPDQDLMSQLKQTVQHYLAWKSIQDDSEALNLDAAQNRETDQNLRSQNQSVEAQIKSTYCWLLIPYIDRNEDLKTIVWDTIRLNGGEGSIVDKAARKMIQNEALITSWAPALLVMELDRLLWQDAEHIAVKQLWEYLSTYCYLPRLANEEVLLETIRTGVNSSEYFALAAGFDGDRYLGLKFQQPLEKVERSDQLVKIGPATKQLAQEAAWEQEKADPPVSYDYPSGRASKDQVPTGRERPDTEGQFPEAPRPEPPIPKNTHFYLSAELDLTRIGRDVQQFVEEVINHLAMTDGAKVGVSLHVEAEAPSGLSQQVVRTVSENCRTLGVKTFGFDD